MADRYWVGNGGNWSDTAHWSASSGGAGGASVPTSSDNVFFNSSSFTIGGQTVSVNAGSTRACKGMDWSGTTNTPTLAMASDLEVYGSTFKLISGMSFTASSGVLYLLGGSGVTLSVTTAGKTIPTNIYAGISSTVISLQDDLTINGEYQQTNSNTSLQTNSYDIACTDWKLGSVVAATLGTTTITSSGGVDFDLYLQEGNELSAAAATIVMTSADTILNLNQYQTIGTVTIELDSQINATGLTIGTLNLTPSQTYTINVSGSNDVINIGAAFNAVGSAGSLITITSSAPHTFNKSGSAVIGKYLHLTNSIATGGASWYAGNSANISGNAGWIFRDAVGLTGVGSTLTLGIPDLGASITPTGFSSTSLGVPSILSDGIVVVGGIASTASFGSPVMNVQVLPESTTSAVTFGTPRLSAVIASGTAYSKTTKNRTSSSASSKNKTIRYFWYKDRTSHTRVR